MNNSNIPPGYNPDGTLTGSITIEPEDLDSQGE
jgi:hypothetical protein